MDASKSAATSECRSVRYTVIAVSISATMAAVTAFSIAIGASEGLNLFELFAIPLFALLFGWITFSSSIAIFGWFKWRQDIARLDATTSDQTTSPELASDSTFSGPTAVLMPVYNEDPRRVYAGVEAMVLSLESCDATRQFDFFILSDSTNPEVWLEEEKGWQALRDRVGDRCRIFYRHRPNNAARKSGNIADFCTRWGSDYPFMIVLDADSLMAGQTMVTMVDRMRTDEKLGILQAPPLPVGRESLFARLQQFGASLYGPVYCEGFASFAGAEGNYWGHNAIIRVQPFMQFCDLPVLPGVAPLGGEILSHDFVEAALMLRAGWKVELATDLGGSFEECPTTLADYAQRDQRWCQGNLQHTRLLIAEGFNTLSRWHFFSGVMSYASAPLWILFTVVSLLGFVWDYWTGSSLRQMIPHSTIALTLFAVSMAILLAPKILTVFTLLRSAKASKPFGGKLRLLASSIFETLMSVLLSPIMAIFHSRFVIAALNGKSVSWTSQQRDEHGVSWKTAFQQHWILTIVGAAVAGVVAVIASQMLIWFVPIFAGLLLSIPLAVALGSPLTGKLLRRSGLLLTPQETSPSKVVQQHQQLLEAVEDSAQHENSTDIFEQLLTDPQLYTLHAAIQNGCDANVEMSPDNREMVVELARSNRLSELPNSLRRSALLDSDLLCQLHVEAISSN